MDCNPNWGLDKDVAYGLCLNCRKICHKNHKIRAVGNGYGKCACSPNKN